MKWWSSRRKPIMATDISSTRLQRQVEGLTMDLARLADKHAALVDALGYKYQLPYYKGGSYKKDIQVKPFCADCGSPTNVSKDDPLGLKSCGCRG
jgi:hypothetical protein